MFSLLTHWLALLRIAQDRRRAIENLSQLSDAQLLDIGIERGTIEDQVRDRLPWQVFESRAAQPMLRSLQGCG